MLIIFIDALPASKEFKIDKLNKVELIPNLGYSVNLHNEIFNGKTPDEMGFFGEYIYYSNVNLTKKYLYIFLNILEFAPFNLNKLFKIFLRKFFNIRVGQIPFGMVPYFKRIGKYPFIGECNSILDNFKKFVTDDMKNGIGNRDKIALNNIFKYFENQTIQKNIFISLCDLDGIGHKFGTKSIEYQNRLKFLKQNSEKLIKSYIKIFPEEPVILLSDHGMSDVQQFIDPTTTLKKIEKKYKLHCFYDSLYLHIFFRDLDKLKHKKKIEKILSEELPIKIFSDDERESFGITNSSFGHIVGLLKNKKAFSPNLFGFLKLKSYHGYLPESKENMGIFLHKNLKFDVKKSISSIDAFKIIHENLSYE